jgi:HSP20 family molecular chaperone IbpA
MERRAFERMEREVRAIHRALTGDEPRIEDLPSDAETPAEDELMRRFTELAIFARANPHVASELSALGFVPPIDVVETGDEVLVEALVPGIASSDVEVHVREQALYLVGARTVDSNGGVIVREEIPRGSFQRVIHLPCEVSPRSRVEVDRGLLRIHLRKAQQTEAAK